MLKIRGLSDSIFEITPSLIAVGVFGLYIYVGNELDVKTAFTLISLFLLFQFPIR